MKHIKPLYESTKAEYNTKIRDLKDKIKDTHDKIDDINNKLRDEKDPAKNELLALGLQKEDLKIEMLRVDLKINKIKRNQL